MEDFRIQYSLLATDWKHVSTKVSGVMFDHAKKAHEGIIFGPPVWKKLIAWFSVSFARRAEEISIGGIKRYLDNKDIFNFTKIWNLILIEAGE